MPNTKKQSDAVDAIHKIQREADMCVFMLVDEDLDAFVDEHGQFTQDEKDDIWERMHEAFLDRYYEILSNVVQDVVNER